MAFTVRQHACFWSGALLALLLIIFVFKTVLLPFVLGAAVAYFLEPVVTGLSRYKLKRGHVALLISAAFYLFLAALAALLLPVMYRQGMELLEDLPGYIDRARAVVEPYTDQALSYIGIRSSADLKALISENSDTAKTVAGTVLGSIAAGSQAVLNFFSILIVMPIVSYFMMKEWTRIKAWMEDLLPKNAKPTILDLLGQINTKLAGFVRGQLIVSTILGLSYAIALTLAGLKYGFLIGIGAGVLSIIPLVGSTIGLLVSVGVAWFQAGEISYVAIIAAIFLVGQVIEGNFLSPKLVGENVGMHPLWVFFALMAGGALFGILGMILAVPVAAIAGVLLAFAIARYKASDYYKGHGGSNAADKEPAAPLPRPPAPDA